MAPAKGNTTSSPAANGVEKKKKEKHMPKALQRKIDGIEEAKIGLGYSVEEVLFDGARPPTSGYGYLPKGSPSLTRTCRMRTLSEKQTHFTVYDSATYMEKGMYVPAVILATAQQNATNAAEARKRKAEKKKAEEAARKKKAPKKNTDNYKKIGGNKRTKKITTGEATQVDRNNTAKGTAKTTPKASFSGNATTKDELAAEESANGVSATGYLNKGVSEAEITKERGTGGGVHGGDAIGHVSDEIAVNETGLAEIHCEESPDTKLEAAQDNIAHDKHFEEGSSGGGTTKEEGTSAASIPMEDAHNGNNY